MDKPLLRRVTGPLFAVLVAAIAYGLAALGTSFDDSIRYSGAVKDFVSAIISTIDRGDAEAAHAELRKFDSVSIETYERGTFLQWLREPLERLSIDSRTEVVNPAQDGG